jgi:hypothetical protein
MPDRGKYDYDVTTGRRTNDDRDSERGRRSGGSIFGGGPRESDEDRDDRSSERGGGWTGRARISAGAAGSRAATSAPSMICIASTAASAAHATRASG